jgi:hypothetical protein
VTATTPEQRYGPTSGSAMGFIGLGACAIVVGLALLDNPTVVSIRVAIVAVAVGILVWAYLLRPRIIVAADDSTLELRNPLSSWWIPVAAVRVVGVKTVTTVKTEDARYDAVAVGYPLRAIVRGRAGAESSAPASGSMPGTLSGSIAIPKFGRGEPAAPAGPTRHADQEIQVLMQDRILAAGDRARNKGLPEAPVRRTYAVLELALLGVTVLAFAATFLV